MPQDGLKRMESEISFQSLFDHMRNGFSYCRMILEGDKPVDFIYLNVNSAFEKITGLKRGHIVGHKVTEAIPGIKEFHPELFDIYGEVAQTGRETSFELEFKPLNIWLSISAYCPRKGYFAAVFEDITDRKKVDGALVLATARLIEAQAVSGVGSWETDLTSLKVEWSRETFRIFELSPDSFSPSHSGFMERVHPEDRAKVEGAFQGAIGRQGHNEIEHRIVTPGGNVKVVVERWQVFYHEQGRPARTLGTCQDITERKRAEEELERQKIALEQKNAALKEILTQIEIEKQKIKDDVAANAQELLLPALNKLKVTGASLKQVALLKKNIHTLTDSFGKRISEKRFKLTPREIQISNMIKEGLTSKDIANLQNCSAQTVEKHRAHIRKKLGISNSDSNLTSYLQRL